MQVAEIIKNLIRILFIVLAAMILLGYFMPPPNIIISILSLILMSIFILIGFNLTNKIHTYILLVGLIISIFFIIFDTRFITIQYHVFFFKGIDILGFIWLLVYELKITKK